MMADMAAKFSLKKLADMELDMVADVNTVNAENVVIGVFFHVFLFCHPTNCW